MPPTATVSVMPSSSPAPAIKLSPGFHLRSYNPKDRKAVCDLFAEGMLFYQPSIEEDPEMHEEFSEYVRECIDKDLATIEATYMGSDGHFWVLTTANDEVVATVALEGKGNGLGELRRVSVNSKYRGYGIGEKLVRHVEQWATERGFTCLQLTTDCVMTPALRLYGRLGYTRTHEEIVRDEPRYYLVWFRKLLATQDD